jgi:hypothetical protein
MEIGLRSVNPLAQLFSRNKNSTDEADREDESVPTLTRGKLVSHPMHFETPSRRSIHSRANMLSPQTGASRTHPPATSREARIRKKIARIEAAPLPARI